MKRLALLAFGFVVLASSDDVAAQSRTDFSGRWTSEPETAAEAPSGQRRRGAGGQRGRRGQRGRGQQNRVGDMGSGWGTNLTVEQTADQLTVEYPFFSRSDLQPPLRFEFALDGSETENSVMMGRGFQAQKSKARWEDDVLVITTVHTFEHPVTGEKVPYAVECRLSLESPTSMLVEVIRSGILGGPSVATRTTYRKV